MIARALVSGVLAAAAWAGVAQAQGWIDSAHGVTVSSDLSSSVTAIQGYVDEHGVPAGRFVVGGQRKLDDGTDLTVSDGDTLTASGTWSGSYCVVVRSAAGQASYYDSTLARTSDAVEPAGACAALAAVGGL